MPLLPTREQLIHALYEAAELEHNLMCTYLYAAFSLKDETEVDTPAEADATSAVGGSPRFGRVNFPIDPGYLPAGIVVKLAPFNEDVLQHFIHLERPIGSKEPDGKASNIRETSFAIHQSRASRPWCSTTRRLANSTKLGSPCSTNLARQ